jgi:multidrug transporter EmrE-like cation transporter
MKTIALLLLIVFEVVILVMTDAFDQSIVVSLAVALFVGIAFVLFVTSDFFFDYQERRRERGRRE